MKMVLNRNKLFHSTKGYSVRFEKDKPVYVPDAIIADVMAFGAIPAEGEKIAEAAEEKVESAPEGAARVEAIKEQFSKMVARNDRDDFTGSGAPNLKVASKEIGFKIDPHERDEIWPALQSKLLNPDD